MLKKLIALLSVFCFLFSSVTMAVSAFNTDNMGEKMVYVLSNVSRDILIPALPFACSDSGLDMLDEALAKQQRGEDAGILSSVIEKALQYTDAVTLQNLFDSLRSLDLTYRQKCQAIYQNQETLSLTAAENQGVEALLELSDVSATEIKAVLNGHLISNGMVANFLKATANLSQSGAPLTMNADGTFAVRMLPSDLIGRLEAIWEADGMALSLEQQLRGGIQKLNVKLTGADINSVGMLFYKVGLLDKAPSYNPPTQDVEKLPGGGAGSFVKDETASDSKQETINVTEAGIISIPGTYTNPVLYRVEEAKLTPVKMALYIDGAMVAELSQGKYTIKEANVQFEDCNGWSKPYVDALYARGIVGGKAAGIFAPEDSITREEFVKLIVELFDMRDEQAVSTFTDVPKDAWYYSYVASAQKYGIVNGISNTEFGVGREIKRQDMAKIISEMLTKKGLSTQAADASAFCDYETISDYARSHVLTACGFGIVSGDDKGNFNPAQSATRGEAAKMIYGVIRAVLLRGE